MITCLLVVVALQLTASYVIPEEAQWSEWSDCTFSCGGGVREQLRQCTNDSCTGLEYQYQSCNIQPCVNSSDPRHDQCSSINYPGLGPWSVLQPDTNTCNIQCFDGLHQTTRRAIDGTPCKTPEGQSGSCLKNACLKLSCNGILGGVEELDKCLNCPGYNSLSCNHYSGVVNNTGVSSNVTLSAGAATISLTITGQVVFTTVDDMQTVSERTQSFVIGGAEFAKQGNGDLFATGPLQEEISILVTNSNHSVEYEYYLSEKEQAPENGSTFKWQFAEFTECSTTCGKGLRVSHAYCQDEEFPEKVIPDWFCSASEKPLPIVRECSKIACPPRWVAGEWNLCKAQCGQGTQDRSVSCQQVDSDGIDEEISDSNCSGHPKPSSTQECFIRQCGMWETGEWGKCSKDCGVGERQREVYCVSMDNANEQIDDSNCENSQKPDKTSPCKNADCTYTWRASSWNECSVNCGEGTQNRDVYCATQYGEHVNDTYCNHSSRPPAEQTCYQTIGCSRRWSHGAWSDCSGTCENAYMERNVSCYIIIDGAQVDQHSSECIHMTKPPVRRSCVKESCPMWFAGDWEPCSVSCGEGQRMRTVECRANGKPASGQCNKDTEPSNTQVCTMDPCPSPDCTNLPGVDCVASVNRWGCIAILREICCLTCLNRDGQN